MNLSRVRPVLAVPVVLSLALLAGCGGSSDEPSTRSTPSGASSASPSTEASTELVTLNGDGFSIDLPTEATKQEQTQQTEAGPVDATYYSAQNATGAFVVALTELPKNVKPNLDGAVDGAVAQVQGTLRENTDSELLGYEARTVRYVAVAADQDVTIFARVVAVEGKLFQVQYVVQAEDLEEPPPIFDEVLATVAFD